MFEPRGSQRGAASAIFNLPDYRVIDAVTGAEGVGLVEVESTAPPGCPVCGVLAGRVHSRRRQRLRDVPVAGPLEVVWVKRRWFCDEPRCRRGTFSEVTAQVPAFARSTARLCQALVAAVVVSGRAASARCWAMRSRVSVRSRVWNRGWRRCRGAGRARRRRGRRWPRPCAAGR